MNILKENILQLKSAYILHNAILVNKLTKMQFQCDLFVLDFDECKIVYDLTNNNLRVSSNFAIKIDKERTKYEMILK